MIIINGYYYKEKWNVCLYFVAFLVQNRITFINHNFLISIFILLHNSADQLINASVSDLFNIPDTKFQNKFQNITV